MISVLLLVASISVTPRIEQSSTPSAELRGGLYCAFVSLRALDFEVSKLAELEKRMGPLSTHGYSLQQISDAAKSYGANTLGVKTTLDHLNQREGRFACITLLEQTNHFVCLYDIDDKYVHVIDPPEQRKIPLEVFSKLWDGKALLIAKNPLGLDPINRPFLPYALGLIGVLVFFAAIWGLRRRFYAKPS